MINRILVPLDGSKLASLILVHVGGKYPSLMPMAERILAQRGCPFEMHLLRGDPANALLQAVHTGNADLLALTTTGQSRGKQIRFGSVAEKILTNCPCPMLVVHAGLTK